MSSLQRNLKIKLNALKALQESDELRLDKLISENKDMKNKLKNLNYVITLSKNVSYINFNIKIGKAQI